MSDDLRAGATEDPHLPDRDIPNALVNSQGEFCFVYGDRDIHESLPIEFPMLPPLGGTKPIEWLWPGRIPLGMVTFLEGAGGSGKTFVVLDMAARVTRGAPWPGKVHGPERAGDVLLVGGDPDGWERVIVPRLMSAGADLTRIGRSHTVDSCDPVVDFSHPQKSRTKRPLSFPHDLPMIEYNIRLRPETRLVVIDPLSAFCADEQAYRATLRQLEEIAERRNVAIVVTARPTARQSWRRSPKECDRRADPVRSVFRVLTDLEDDRLYHLAPVRMSFCAEPEWLPFRIGPKDAALQPMVAWGPPAESPPESAVPRTPAREGGSIRESVKEWLLITLLKSDMPCQMMVQEAKGMGFSEMTFRRAREALGVRMFRGAGGPFSSGWWTLRPKSDRPDIPPGGLPDEATLAKIQNWETGWPDTDAEDARVDEILREFEEVDAGLASAAPAPPETEPNGSKGRSKPRSRRKRSSWVPEVLRKRMMGAMAAALFAGQPNPIDSNSDDVAPGDAEPDADSSANGKHKSNGRRKRKPK